MNLRPSGYEPDELPDCSTPRHGCWVSPPRRFRGTGIDEEREEGYWSGGDLLSHVLRRSTIGATGLNGRVRDGIGCFPRAVTTRPGEAMRASPLQVGFLARVKSRKRLFGSVLCACAGSTCPPRLPAQPPMVPGHDRWLGGEAGWAGGARRKRQLSEQAQKNQAEPSGQRSILSPRRHATIRTDRA